jgi:uncharacterized protein
MHMLSFSWDENKSKANLAKHGIRFELAQLVFDDPLHLTRQDRTESGEQRWQTLGLILGEVLCLVAHTWTDVGSVEHIRIISARKATKLERKLYEENG